MQTVVVKGSDYSFSDLRKLSSVDDKNIKLVLVYPTGVINEFFTNKRIFMELEQQGNSVIFSDTNLYEMS